MSAFLAAHAALLVIVWPALTAVASLLYTLADKSPRTHGALSTLAGLGIDLPKVWEALGRLVTGSTVKIAGVVLFVIGLSFTSSACINGHINPNIVAPTAKLVACFADEIAKGITDPLVAIPDCGAQLGTEAETVWNDLMRANREGQRIGAERCSGAGTK